MKIIDERKISIEAPQQIRHQAIHLKSQKTYQRLRMFINQQLPSGTILINEKSSMLFESRKEVDAWIGVEI